VYIGLKIGWRALLLGGLFYFYCVFFKATFQSSILKVERREKKRVWAILYVTREAWLHVLQLRCQTFYLAEMQSVGVCM